MSRRYIPKTRISVDADVSLDEFDDSDIAEYLRGRGYYVSASAKVLHDQDCELALDPDDLYHIETLEVCGQIEAARNEALALVSNAIGRTLK